ncbi:glycosyl hydrolases family 16 [Klebsormidium nitens]|uniref:Glycosyl hydrolases family 16 n=1 Tax=Klebsormidium nitens TaxID=105231 RepID=A0A1Y1HIL6_KLENI|nr:glycosyl hydrolases family 16 [Klebsormidium nitens]|eukprot:GAQ78335.1 glycosyl hydrolases family 16 [Klebsormidium nitens]
MAAARGSLLMPAGGLLVVLCVVVFFVQSVQAVNATAPANSTSLLSVIDYSPDHVSYSGNIVTLKMDSQSGSRVHSVGRYAYGVFSADIKCPAGDTVGLIPTFYTSSLEGSEYKDELDWEFLGKNSSIIQTNVWVDGVGKREAVHDLGFDCSQAFHKYTIDWNPLRAKWFIDGQLVRTYVNTGNASEYPTKPAYAYASIWDSGYPGEGWNGRATYANAPYFYQLANVTVSSPGSSTGPSSAPRPAPARSPVGSPVRSPVKITLPGRKLFR